MPQTTPPGSTTATVTTAPSMPPGPLPNPVAPGPLPVPDYWRYNPLPAAWNSTTNIAQVIASQKVVLDRLKALDEQAAKIEEERTFIHRWLSQINTTGHS